MNRILVSEGACQHYVLTLFELDPDPSIILNLLDHLAVPTNDDANSKSGNNHLDKEDAKKTSEKEYILPYLNR